jgi:hypothetical protein
MRVAAPHRAQCLDGFRQSKLLANKAVDETSAADLAACFQTPIHGQQTTPRRHTHLAREEVAEDDPIALK